MFFPSKPASVIITIFFFMGATLFLTSMLSNTKILSEVGEEVCTPSRFADQVILFVFDAMRPDFALKSMKPFAKHGGRCSEELTLEERNTVYTRPTITYIEKALQHDEGATHGFFLVADAPTTTSQRIKAIATGTLPAFLEAAANFNSDESTLDSFVQQSKGRAVFLGDDTWTKLFPLDSSNHKYWKSVYDLPSLDVSDFDSNDNLIQQHIYRILGEETPEAVAAAREAAAADGAPVEPHAELIVAHFLGVDHIGHRYNSDNTYMDAKLAELDGVLHSVTAALSARNTNMSTMLLLLGDHGMTQSGDHGGDTQQETDTFLFAQYFPPHQGAAADAAAAAVAAARKEEVERLTRERWERMTDKTHERFVACRDASGLQPGKLSVANQVDVPPTITALLGHPLPYSNLGRVLPEVMAMAGASAAQSAIDECNFQQIMRYCNNTKTSLEAIEKDIGPGVPIRDRVAALSAFMRGSRSAMQIDKMAVGCTIMLISTMTLFYFKPILLCLRQHYVLGNMGFFLMVVVLVLPFSNGLVVNQDVIMIGGFVVLCLVAVVAVPLTAEAAAASGRGRLLSPSSYGIIILAVFIRLVASGGLRHREHITHEVARETAFEHWIQQAFPSARSRDLRIVTAWASVLWLVLIPTRGSGHVSVWHSTFFTLVAWATCALVRMAPIWHHVIPLQCVANYAVARLLRRRQPRKKGQQQQHDDSRGAALPLSHFAYFMWVMWTGSLCNENIVVAIVIVTYGVYLPTFLHCTRHLPTASRAALLFFAAHSVFFLQGHQYMINTIDWNASFVGMPFYNMLGGGILVVNRSLNAFLFTMAAVCVFEKSSRESVSIRHYLLHFQIAVASLSCLNAFSKRKHLFLYTIFCPKMIFDIIITASLALAYVLTIFS